MIRNSYRGAATGAGGGGEAVEPGAGSGFGPLRVIRGGADGSLAETGDATFESDEGEDLIVLFDLSPSGSGDGGGWLAYLSVAPQATPGDAGNGLTFTAGRGAHGSGATPGAAGGNREDYSGNGGDGTATAAAGPPGYIFFAPGFPGANNGGGGAAGGDAYFDATAGTGAARHGDIFIGASTDSGYNRRYLQMLTSTTGQMLVGATAPIGAEKGRFSGSISPAASADGVLYRFDGTIVEAGSGTHALLALVRMIAPTITSGAGAVTNAATLYVSGAPSATVTGWAAALAVAPDTDDLTVIGRGKIGATTSDSFTLAHFDRFTSSGFMIQQRGSDGATFLNSAANLYFSTSATLRWQVDNADGHLYPYVHNTVDIGITGTRPRDLYLSRDIEIDGAFNHDGSTFGALNVTPATQAAKINDATGGAIIDAESRVVQNAIIDVLERFGFSAAA